MFCCCLFSRPNPDSSLPGENQTDDQSTLPEHPRSAIAAAERSDSSRTVRFFMGSSSPASFIPSLPKAANEDDELQPLLIRHSRKTANILSKSKRLPIVLFDMEADVNSPVVEPESAADIIN